MMVLAHQPSDRHLRHLSFRVDNKGGLTGKGFWVQVIALAAKEQERKSLVRKREAKPPKRKKGEEKIGKKGKKNIDGRKKKKQLLTIFLFVRCCPLFSLNGEKVNIVGVREKQKQNKQKTSE